MKPLIWSPGLSFMGSANMVMGAFSVTSGWRVAVIMLQNTSMPRQALTFLKRICWKYIDLTEWATFQLKRRRSRLSDLDVGTL